MITQNQNNIERRNRTVGLLGLALILLGALVITDQYLKTGWLPWAAVMVVGLGFLAEGLSSAKTGWLIAGSLLAGAGLGTFLVFSSLFDLVTPKKIGMLLLALTLGWVLITVSTALSKRKTAFWALVPGGVFVSVGLCLVMSDLSLLSFVLYIVTGVGLILLVWGLFWKLYGLIIPGSLLVTIGPGIAAAWGTTLAINPLSKTGLMIAAFSFGWGLIVFFSRFITAKFVWWPLIPGGIMAMVGWGLYIGGDPGNAPSFIANTGSVGLIIFGLYLLLLRKSIHR